jgi:hypothetical protein
VQCAPRPEHRIERALSPSLWEGLVQISQLKFALINLTYRPETMATGKASVLRRELPQLTCAHQFESASVAMKAAASPVSLHAL